MLELNKIYNMDCLDGMKLLDDNSVDSIVTDPPYELGFMGKKWDKTGIAYNVDLWRECLRVLKPGGHMLVAGIGRTHHRVMCAIEDTGFEIRDCIYHIFGSGFPKSLDIKKKIEGEWKCKLEKVNVNNVEELLYQYIGQKETGGQDFVVELVLPIVKNVVNIENVNNVEKNFMCLKHILTEKTEETKGFFVVKNVKQNGKNNLQAQIILTGKTVDLLDRTDMWLSILATENINWNMILSWKNILEENLKKGSKFITLTEIKQIIGLKIWNSLQYLNTLKSIVTINHTALKPAAEIWILARKPLSEKNVALNVLKWGTGGINIDGCRIGTDTITSRPSNMSNNNHYAQDEWTKSNPIGELKTYTGRFPANVILDEEAGKLLDEQSGISKGSSKPRKNKGTGNICYGDYKTIITQNDAWGDSGGASRFFYCAKASKKERGEGNNHPTVKPVSLIKYLVTLVTPPNGVCLDPFMGSGTTAIACINTNRNFIGFEIDKHYCDIANERIRKALAEKVVSK